jgi:PKD repeat protein
MKRILIFLFLITCVGVASAGEAYTAFTAYGDGWKSTNDTYTVLKWNTTGARTPWNTTDNVTANSVIEYVIVAGGGGGGKALGGGGGGAGAYWEGSFVNVSGAIPITVGAGGAQSATNNTVGTAGGISIFHNITAMGGSGGGSAYMSNVSQGGSAGGAGTRYNGGAGAVWQSNISNQTGHGNRGGFSVWNTTSAYAGGGGGGYALYGANASSASTAGKGGNGSYTNITGTLITLAGGGGGGTYSSTASFRGIGGGNATTGTTVGGSGAYRTTAASAAVANTGSGGGGGGSTGAGTAGSGGVVIIRFIAPTIASFTSNVTSGYTPLSVQFNDTSSSSISQNWSFNNVTGNNTEVWWSQEKNPAIAFGVGNWSIKLNSSNSVGYNITPGTYFVNVSPPNPNGVLVMYPAYDRLVWSSDTNVAFNTLHTASGSNSDASTDATSVTSGTSAWNDIHRSILSFNLNNATLSGKTITGITLSLYGNTKTNSFAASPSMIITDVNPTAWNGLQTSDYNKFGTTIYGNLTYAAFTTSVYNNITLDSDATTYFTNRIGTNASIGITNSWDTDGNPAFEASKTIDMEGGCLAEAGTSIDPFITITYTTGGGGGSAPVSSFTTPKALIRIPKLVTVVDTSTNTPTQWNWSWGDGTWTNGTTQNPVHRYTDRGKFGISLLSSNSYGSSTSGTQTVKVTGYENYY